MNHARTNDPLPFLPCFTPKDVDPSIFWYLQVHVKMIYSVQYFDN